MKTKVTLIIPIYNEAANLLRFLERIDALDLGADVSKELIFVDDCSSDNSFSILNGFSFSSQVKIQRHEVNKGKGSALHTGIGAATGDIIGIQDADFEYDMNDIPRLIEPIVKNRADVVYGSRFTKTNPQVHRTFHYLVNRFLTLLSNVLSGLYLSDMETCYKFIRSDILKNIELESERFGFEVEITAKLARLKIRVMELSISYHARTYLDGKKITWKDGVAALFHILRFNLFSDKKRYLKDSLNTSYLPVDRNLL